MSLPGAQRRSWEGKLGNRLSGDWRARIEMIVKTVPDLIIDVTRLDDGWPELSIDPAVYAALAEVDAPHLGELSVVLSHDEAVQDLNRRFRDRDRPTNVLSFPMPPDSGLMGDVVLARQTIAREASEQGKTFENHFTHLLIHGVLHLQGSDHQTDAQAADMEAREVRALARLSIDNPYSSDRG